MGRVSQIIRINILKEAQHRHRLKIALFKNTLT